MYSSLGITVCSSILITYLGSVYSKQCALWGEEGEDGCGRRVRNQGRFVVNFRSIFLDLNFTNAWQNFLLIYLGE